MRSVDLRLLLAAGALLSMAAGATSRAGADWSGQATRLAAAEHFASALPTRVALPLLVGPQEVAVAKEYGRWGGPSEEPPLPDIAGRWMGIWSGYGVIPCSSNNPPRVGQPCPGRQRPAGATRPAS